MVKEKQVTETADLRITISSAIDDPFDPNFTQQWHVSTAE